LRNNETSQTFNSIANSSRQSFGVRQYQNLTKLHEQNQNSFFAIGENSPRAATISNVTNKEVSKPRLAIIKDAYIDDKIIVKLRKKGKKSRKPKAQQKNYTLIKE